MRYGEGVLTEKLTATGPVSSESPAVQAKRKKRVNKKITVSVLQKQRNFLSFTK